MKKILQSPRPVYTGVLLTEDSYGKPHDVRRCVLATELKDRYPELVDVRVKHDKILLVLPSGDHLSWPTPKKVMAWIKRWDRGDRRMEAVHVVLKSRTAKVTTAQQVAERRAKRAEQTARRQEVVCKERGITKAEHNREKHEERLRRQQNGTYTPYFTR